MPKIQNLRRVKDTVTGLYLRSVAEAGRTWATHSGLPKNNSWTEKGTLYKTVHLPRVIRDASHALACLEWVRMNGPVKWPDGESWEQSRDEFLARKRAMHTWATEHAQIPDTWVIETVEIQPVVMEGKEVLAKDWEYVPIGQNNTLGNLQRTKRENNGWPR